MFIETSASIVALAPIAVQFGLDPVHFGLVLVLNLALSMITPPFCVNQFAACSVADISLDRVARSLVPFILVVSTCLMVITYVPVSVSLFAILRTGKVRVLAGFSRPRWRKPSRLDTPLAVRPPASVSYRAAI